MRLRKSVVPALAAVLAIGFAAQAQPQGSTVTCPTLKKTQDSLSLRFYWASWCGPCTTMIPLLDGASNVIKVEKIDIDANAKAAAAAGVKSIPMIVFWQDGKVIGSKVGAVGQQGLCDWIRRMSGQEEPPPPAVPAAPASPG